MKINDLDLSNWKTYSDLITDSLWIIERRDNSGAHEGSYWGNFIPQIPNQLLRRFTKKYEWVLDPFLGSGTTLIECKKLGRNGIGIDISKEAIELSKNNIAKEKDNFNVKIEIFCEDSLTCNFKNILSSIGIEHVQFVILHPPYWDIIKFSNDEKDLSNSKSLEEFLSKFNKVLDNSVSVLEKGRYFALVIGDKYSHGEWIPLGFYTMNEIIKKGYILKSIIVKNIGETKGKKGQKSLWRYRALANGFYVFTHEYIFLFYKP